MSSTTDSNALLVDLLDSLTWGNRAAAVDFARQLADHLADGQPAPRVEQATVKHCRNHGSYGTFAIPQTATGETHLKGL